VGVAEGVESNGSISRASFGARSHPQKPAAINPASKARLPNHRNPLPLEDGVVLAWV